MARKTPKKIKVEMDVVGLKFRMKRDARADLATRVKRMPMTVKLRREQENKYDINAIRVEDSKGKHLGYIRRESAEVLAPRIDEQEIRVDSAELVGLYADQDNANGQLKVTLLDYSE